ncbi:hypothetical protein BU16DRAFT_57901 [Lophium mytilinum]|uniref:Uncharacterized protein n=1 Tax=Lophium mytilinum TaxID=390894 RepID=A0A6A6QSI4_9PEZI|nr:hypothetical protein BU16DRAFT_57901 [Lophium mytilinum]
MRDLTSRGFARWEQRGLPKRHCQSRPEASMPSSSQNSIPFRCTSLVTSTSRIVYLISVDYAQVSMHVNFAPQCCWSRIPFSGQTETKPTFQDVSPRPARNAHEAVMGASKALRIFELRLLRTYQVCAPTSYVGSLTYAASPLSS